VVTDLFEAFWLFLVFALLLAAFVAAFQAADTVARRKLSDRWLIISLSLLACCGAVGISGTVMFT
jgi:putative copper export protein